MALTLTQQPTTPNASRTNLLYTLTSDSSSKDQFRYIAQVSTDEPLQSPNNFFFPEVTLKYYPNTTGSGIIDLANVLNRYLAWDENSMAWSNPVTVPFGSEGQSTVQIFSCSFGEEFADSPSSSLQTYTGSIVDILTVFQGKVDRDSGDYNFNTASIVNDHNNIFSDMPDVLYSQSQYDFFQECPKVGFQDPQTVTVNDNVAYSVKVYEEAANGYTGSVLLTATGSTTEFHSIVGVGPINITQDSTVPNNGVVTGSDAAWICFEQTGKKPINYMLPNHSRYPCTADGDPGSYTRFLWQNNYGAWDFYNVYNTLQQTDNVERETYTQPFPTYNQTTSPFNINNRGEKQYSSILTEQFTVTTDYVSKKTSDWLTQMFDSNNVYLRIGPYTGTYLTDTYSTDLRAIVINNVNYRWQENKFRNKTFQYTINWSFSNKSFVY